MLFHIVNPNDDEFFKKCVDYIKKAFWPKEKYRQKLTVMLRQKCPRDKIIEEINSKLEAITKKIQDEEGLYAVVRSSGNVTKKYEIPFIDRFHALFLERYYNGPVRDPQGKIQELISELIRLDKRKGGNYSKNKGNYYHFINVVMATARLIMYFKECKNIQKLFSAHTTLEEIPATKPLCRKLRYRKIPNIRTFKLMLAAFYHDIGKTIVDHRHGMEGAFIIAEHTTQSLYCLKNIVQQHKFKDKFKKDDLLSIADFLNYHDLFGTLNTGESSYILLADILNKIKRYSLRHIGNPEKIIEHSQRDLFDLWVLNMADIMVSERDKLKLQEKLWSNSKSAKDKIENFFKSDSGARPIHDLRVSMRLLENLSKATHTDDTSGLERLCREQAKNHAIERIRRLVCSSLRLSLEERKNTDKMGAVLDQIFKILIKVPENAPRSAASSKRINPHPQGVMNTIIYRCIESLSDPQEFYQKFSWIGCMDYSLGFFQAIVKRALNRVKEELEDNTNRTGWIRTERPKSGGNSLPSDYLDEANAMFFIENYCSMLVRILGYLLFRERSMEKPFNIEFEDTRKRLTNDKIDKIMAMEGPYRANRSIELILKTVFVY